MIAALLLAAATSLTGGFSAPRRAATPPPVQAPRLYSADAAPLVLAGTRIESLLTVPAPMRYGQWTWQEDGVPAGPLWVRVDRRAQLISVFRGAHEIGTAVILYGAPAKPTPAGRYPILAKHRDYRSVTYGADMPYSLRLTSDGVAIHASEVREGRATHGCIGVPQEFARRLFEAATAGDPVVIV